MGDRGDRARSKPFWGCRLGEILRYIFLSIIILFFSACSNKELMSEKELGDMQEQIDDLVNIPQDSAYFAVNLQEKNISDLDTFIEKYFRPWNRDTISIDQHQATWAYVYDNNNTYSYTLQPIEKDFFPQLKENSNMQEFGTLNQLGLSLGLLNLRALPSEKPVFLDPKKAGEGYPFDYLQNSSLAPNKPLMISHYSKDKQWAFIECSFGFGWVKAGEIVAIDKQYTALWQQAQQVFLLKDNVSIYDQEENYLFDSRIGMMLPLIDEDEQTYTVLTVSKTKDNKALYLQSKISKEYAHKGILPFNSENVVKVISELQKGSYGWGGIYGQRDCSSTLRDLYTPFGFWLPRNSSVQAKMGHVEELSTLSNQEKIDFINDNAVPFETLLYRKGHIVLYVGKYKNDAIVFQNVWGVKTRDKKGIEGRYLIAKPILSTLEVGKNLKEFDDNASTLTQLKSMNTLFENSSLDVE